MKAELAAPLAVLANPGSSKTERQEAFDSITNLLLEEKANHPEKYEESLSVLRDFLQMVRVALSK